MNTLSERTLLIALVCVFALVLGAGIGGPDVMTMGDESDYIQSSQEMLASGDLLTPTLRGERRFTKPPLLYWMMVTSYHTFGVSYFAARAPIVITGVLCVLFVFKCAALMYDRRAALIAALMTGTSMGMVHFSKIAFMDMPLTCTLMGAYYFFAKYYKSNQASALNLALVFLGVTALWKSPAYSVIGFTTMVAFLLWEGEHRRIWSKAFLTATALGVLVGVSWYALMLIKHGMFFVDYYLDEHVTKFDERTVDRLYVFKGLLLYALPWTVYLVYAVYAVVRDGLYRDWRFKLPLAAIGCFLFVFLFPTYTRHYYAIPMLPCAGLLVGGVLSRVPPGRVWNVSTALLLLAFAAVFGFAALLPNPASLVLLVAIAMLVAAAWLLAARAAHVLAALLVGLPLTLFYTHVLPNVNLDVIPARDVQRVVETQPLVTFELSPLRFEHSLRRDIPEVKGFDGWQAELAAAIEAGSFVIIQPRHLRMLQRSGVEDVEVYLVWQRWRRRIPAMEIITTLLSREAESLQEDLYLVGRKRAAEKSETSKLSPIMRRFSMSGETADSG